MDLWIRKDAFQKKGHTLPSRYTHYAIQSTPKFIVISMCIFTPHMTQYLNYYFTIHPLLRSSNKKNIQHLDEFAWWCFNLLHLHLYAASVDQAFYALDPIYFPENMLDFFRQTVLKWIKEIRWKRRSRVSTAKEENSFSICWHILL